MLNSRESSGHLYALIVSWTIGTCLGWQQCKARSCARSPCAQSATATLDVTVVDPDRAAIPGAHISMTNASTGARRERLTNNDGQAAVTQLAPGRYRIAAARRVLRQPRLKSS